MSDTARFYAPSEVSIEQLRAILEERSGNQVSFEEAEEVGIQLVSLYECLARERDDKEAT
jgi:hypothetical protein